VSQFKKYHPSGNPKFANLGIFQSLKLCILMEKILPISLELNFTPDTLGCYGLNRWKQFLSVNALENLTYTVVGSKVKHHKSKKSVYKRLKQG